MENSLEDQISNYDGEYLVNGMPAENPPYVNDLTERALLLGQLDGLRLPTSLSEKIDTSGSIEISFDVKLKELNREKPFKFVFTNALYGGQNGPGISIFARSDIFDSDTTRYTLNFNYADGGFDQGVPDHPGHSETELGQFQVGEVVSIRLILDFENDEWIALANDEYTKVAFDPLYDLSKIKKTMIENPIMLGWAGGLEFDIDYDPESFKSVFAYDNLEIYSPRKPGNAADLNQALIKMTNHLNGSEVLSEEEQIFNLGIIQLNYDGNYQEAKDNIFTFINTYEIQNDPVFTDRFIRPLSELDPLALTLIFLQQSIHDGQFIKGNIQAMEGISFEAHKIFPGIVKNEAPRLNNVEVEINGSYSIIPGARIAADLDDAKRPAGYYAAPGEVVKVTIPASLADAGLKIMIGAHDTDLSPRKGGTNRFVRISKTFELTSEVTFIANPFGGGIYIKVPEGSELGWIKINIDGAVKSPYFSYRTDRITSNAEFMAELAEENVPWADLESDKYMMTLPVQHVISAIPDPTDLMIQWGAIMDGFRYVGGRPNYRSRSEYFLVDSRLPADAFGTGYPQVIGDENAPYGIQGSAELFPTQILKPDFYKSGFYITLHEMGHGALHPTLITEVETIIHLNATYIYNQNYEQPLDTAFKYSSGEFHTMDEATIDWMIADNFRNNRPMGCDPTMEFFLCDELRYQHRGHAKYIEMADLFGWEAVHGMNKYFYDKWKAVANPNMVVVPDDMIRAASEAVGVNMAPLMHFWGLVPSDELAQQLFALPESREILERLLYYKELVPKTKEAFQPWYNKNYPKKDPVHYMRYNAALNNYDSEEYGKAMIDQIDFLIDTYFPNGIDIDNDGFGDDVDCDDNNAGINPGAQDIADNGIDEDCDGMDATVSAVHQLGNTTLTIYPNPVADRLFIRFDVDINNRIRLMDLSGKELLIGDNLPYLNLADLNTGVYILVVTDVSSGLSVTEKIVKI